jgi:GntR family transcriptional regulator/MocR family aminotransferase
VGAGDGAAAAHATRFDLAPGDPGEPTLRRAIVDYLRLSRSIDCQPEQVLITGNYAAL